MKFTDGFWVLKPGVTMVNCREVQDARWEEEGFTVYCSHLPVNDRGMTLNAPLLTLTFRAPRPGILALTVSHFLGTAIKAPMFELFEQPASMSVQEDDNAIVITSGSLSAVVTRKPFSLAYFENGVRLTGLGDRHMSYAKTPDGAYMRVKLDVGVGEKLYGLGERFTPMVKNGQVVDIWNEDGGTASELSYKNIPFYITNRGYGVLVNSTGKVSYELCSEAVESAQFSLAGEQLTFMVIGGGSMKGVIERYTALTGRAALPPAWSFGLWLTTSFTTKYNEETILSFVDGMAQRNIPLHVFHFDCFWMKGYEWCNLDWDRTMQAEAAAALETMFAAAKAEKVGLSTVSGYRSYTKQATIYARKKKKSGQETADSLVALPGSSEHQLGIAMDLAQKGGSQLNSGFGKTKAGQWINANAYKYGFIVRYQLGKEEITGYAYEPWHAFCPPNLIRWNSTSCKLSSTEP